VVATHNRTNERYEYDIQRDELVATMDYLLDKWLPGR